MITSMTVLGLGLIILGVLLYGLTWLQKKCFPEVVHR